MIIRISIVYLLLLVCLVSSGQTITTFAGNGNVGFSGDGGLAVNAKLYYPAEIVEDNKGNFYIPDYSNYRVRKIDADGIITTFAGTGDTDLAGMGGPAIAAHIGKPMGMTFDKWNNGYVICSIRSGMYGNEYIFKIDTLGGISVFAGGGSGASGLAENIPATNAILFGISITMDKENNILYVPDKSRLRVIDSIGNIHTIAGDLALNSSGDGGPASAAELNNVNRVCISKQGEIYLSEYNSNTIRKIDRFGDINTIAGTGTAGLGGENTPAIVTPLNMPGGLSLDNRGNLFFTELGNHRVRKIDTNGVVTTFAGGAVSGPLGDGGPASAAKILQPDGLCVDKHGNMYIADVGNDRIRVIHHAVSEVAIPERFDANVLIFPNPSNGCFTISYRVPNDNATTLSVFNMLGHILQQWEVRGAGGLNVSLNLAPGSYLLKQASKSAQQSMILIII